MEKTRVSAEILQQLEKLAREASQWARDFDHDSKDIDPSDSENGWTKQRENRNPFRYYPLP